MSDIVLDEYGNLDTSKIEKSMRNALEYDIRYKQTDNMKKRAIRVAGSYEEFKNMVACAHLKKLSRKEIESLKMSKREAKLSQVPKESTDASILVHEQLEESKSLEISKPKKLPKTPLELWRDLRRISEPIEKYQFLNTIGAKKLSKLLLHESDAELYESVLQLLVDNESDVIQLLQFLNALSNVDNFGIFQAFFTDALKEKLRIILQGDAPGVNECRVRYIGS